MSCNWNWAPKVAEASDYDYFNVIHTNWSEDGVVEFSQITTSGQAVYQVSVHFADQTTKMYDAGYSHSELYTKTLPIAFSYSIGGHEFAKINWDASCGRMEVDFWLERNLRSRVTITNMGKATIMAGTSLNNSDPLVPRASSDWVTRSLNTKHTFVVYKPGFGTAPDVICGAGYVTWPFASTQFMPWTSSSR